MSRPASGGGCGAAGEPVHPHQDDGPPEPPEEVRSVGIGVPVEPEEWRRLKERSEEGQTEPGQGQQDEG
jgi:hypothetical protein